MKIALISDFHLGYSQDSLPQARDALSKACSIADMVVLAGDLFDSRVPRQETIYEAIGLFRDFKPFLKKEFSASISSREGFLKIDFNPFVAIYGTHERRAKGLVNAIQLLDSAGLVLNIHSRVLLVEGNGEKIAFQGMGGVPEEFAKRTLEQLSPKPVPGFFNVFVFHQTLREIIPADENALSASDLPRGFDLYVDGHLHCSEVLNEDDKLILLPGSTVVTQMKPGEAREKGFFVFDTSSRQHEFISINSRKFFYERLEFSSATLSEIEDRVRKKLDELSKKASSPLVKLKLTGTLAKGVRKSDIDLISFEKEFKEKLFLSIDKDFSDGELRQKIDFVRRMRDEKHSVSEIGLEILKKKLYERGYCLGLEGDLLELLGEGEIDLAIKKIMERKKGFTACLI